MDLNIEELQLIVFNIGKEEYAVPIECVQEIIMPQNTTHMPKSPDFLEGIINLRGKIIPVIDGRKKFCIAGTSSDSEKRIIILELENATTGLIVDAVSEVIYLKKENIEPTPQEFSDNSFILGVGKYKDRLIILLDSMNFLNWHETEKISEFIEFKEKTKEAMEVIEAGV